MIMTMRRYRIVFLLLAMAGSGCLGPKPPGAGGPSAFYKQADNLNRIVPQLAADNGCKIGNHGAGSSSGSGGHGSHSSLNFNGDFRGTPNAADKLMRALQAELEKMAQTTGASIDETVEGGGAGERLVGFEFDYTAGNAHGQVAVKLESGEPNARKDKKDQHQDYKLSIRVQEWVR
jgi:hypothetical protein